MALANLGSFFVAGIPLCHGAGGLASRYRFGARTAGSNIIIGTVFLLSALFLGTQLLLFIHLIPFSVLGVLLVFAGIQLSLTILDVKVRKELFVVIMILGITLTANLAVGFLIGIVLDHLLRLEKLSV
jgi:SulP family sulfate permease